ncbi:MAG TPA: amino acid ABC transporter substrate-binding protein [Devosiaceae bacterium]|nr:amino acid ABC transporter substrate-binding protein [Devosiaceae bacterium]
MRLLLVLVFAFWPAFAAAQTLDAVKARGFLRCASTETLPGFSQVSAEGLWSGFDVDVCRAVAAAIFGDPNRVEFISLTGQSRFAPLQSGEIDMMARNAPWTMRRDIHFGVRYVATFFHDGQAFMLRNHSGVVSALGLRDVSVCAIDGSDHADNMRRFFFAGQVSYTEVLYEDKDDLITAYRTGLCDVLTANATRLFAIRSALGDQAGHRILPERLSKEPIGPVIRSGDNQWRNIVQWTLFAMINAEELGVSSMNVDSMTESRNPAIRRLLGLEGDFGSALGLTPGWARNIIAGVGNYAQVFDRNLGASSPLGMIRGQNALWTKGGLMYAPPIR